MLSQPRGAGVTRGDPRRRPERFIPRHAAAEAPYGADPAEAPTHIDRKRIDIHEVLKREAFAAPQPSCDDHFEKSRPCPSGVYGVSDQYIVLDSFEKVQSSQVDRGTFQWNFAVQGSTTGDQVIGVRDRIDTVIEIQIGGFDLPILEEVAYVLAPPPATPGLNQLVLVHNNNNGAAGPPTMVVNAPPHGQYPYSILPTPATFLHPWINNPYTQLPFGNRLTVQIKEAGLQSYSDKNGARHHFELSISHLSLAGITPVMLQAVPAGGMLYGDTFVFTDPLKDVQGITLVFRNPDIPIRFLPDCLYGVPVVTDGAGPPGPYLRFDAVGHGLLQGDRVYIQGYNSGISTLDAYVNRPDGHVAASDPTPPAPVVAPATPIPTPNSFWLDPSVSVINFAPPPPPPPAAQIVTVCIAKRRLRVPMRLRRVVGRLTNYVAP